MTALGQPFNWHLDIFWTLAIPVLLAVYLKATRVDGRRPSRRRRSARILFLALNPPQRST